MLILSISPLNSSTFQSSDKDLVVTRKKIYLIGDFYTFYF